MKRQTNTATATPRTSVGPSLLSTLVLTAGLSSGLGGSGCTPRSGDTAGPTPSAPAAAPAPAPTEQGSRPADANANANADADAAATASLEAFRALARAPTGGTTAGTCPLQRYSSADEVCRHHAFAGYPIGACASLGDVGDAMGPSGARLDYPRGELDTDPRLERPLPSGSDGAFELFARWHMNPRGNTLGDRIITRRDREGRYVVLTTVGGDEPIELRAAKPGEDSLHMKWEYYPVESEDDEDIRVEVTCRRTKDSWRCKDPRGRLRCPSSMIPPPALTCEALKRSIGRDPSRWEQEPEFELARSSKIDPDAWFDGDMESYMSQAPLEVHAWLRELGVTAPGTREALMLLRTLESDHNGYALEEHLATDEIYVLLQAVSAPLLLSYRPFEVWELGDGRFAAAATTKTDETLVYEIHLPTQTVRGPC